MKKIGITFFALLLASSTAFAGMFYYKEHGKWTVFGMPPSIEYGHDSGCTAVTKWEDGSMFMIIQDLGDMELLLQAEIKPWKLKEDRKGKFTFFFTNPKESTKQILAGEYNIKDSELWIRNLDHSIFLPYFQKFKNLTIVLDTGEMVDLELTNADDAMQSIAACISAANKPHIDG